MQCPVRPPSSAIDPSSVDDVEGDCTKGVLVLVSCACLLVLCALCMFVVQQMLRTPYVSLPFVCTTEDCVTHARRILRTLDASANPCLSFHSYVCGGGSADVASDDVHVMTAPSAGVASNYAWEAGDRLLRRIDPARRLARVYARQIVPLNLLSGKGNSATASKARAALELCLTGRVARRPPASLPFFMRQRGLTWPTPFRGHITLIRVLSVLLDLSVKWNAAPWFDVRVGGLDDPAYESTAHALARYLSMSDTEDPFKGAASLKQLKRDEKALREAILFALSGGDDIGDRSVPLRDSGSAVFEGVSPSDWTSLLVEHLGSSEVKGYGVNITLDTTLLVLNGRLFAGLSRLAVEIPAARLLDVVGWMFAYSYAWIENRLFDHVPPSVTDATADPTDPTVQILCNAVVLESFGIAPVAPLFSRMFPSQERTKVAAVLNATAHTLVETVRSSRGVLNATKNRAGAKITAHTFQVLWPPQPFLNPDLLDTLYSSYPSAEPSTFYESWLKYRRAQRAWLVRHHYGTLMTLSLRWYTEEILYVYSLNYMVLGLAAVFPPLHDYDGAGTGLTWWERENSSAECRLDRARSEHEARAIGDLFALDVALAAMKRVSEDSPLRLKLLEKLTATQTFYVSYCSRFCGDPDAREKCDLAMNGSEFQAAFDCQWWMFDRGCPFV
ncbi:hypothetical protein HPB49_008145 [Dermacentor silvarum]|uniref:Uncharacterized protein n=1 Tax=Dermacentor silvarum TaxID=543639 RepID=A0ACB8CQF6_DERSI|nr:hypothetical protein HPB49_008145 [Dermacentor silvarum]